MKILSTWTYTQGSNWGEIYESGMAIYWEDENLRVGTLYVSTDEEKVLIDTQDTGLTKEQYLDLMSKLYDMAEIK